MQYTFLFITIPFIASAQSFHGGFGVAQIGGIHNALNAINRNLTDAGHKKFEPRFTTYGGGGYAVMDNLIFGGEGHALSSQEALASGGSVRNELEGHYGLLRLGYIVKHGRRWVLFPMLGYGQGRLKLKTDESGTIRTTKANGSVFDLGLGLQMGPRKKNNRISGLLIGLTAGYCWNPAKFKWKNNSIVTADDPTIGLTGPYLRLTFGGGSFKMRKGE